MQDFKQLDVWQRSRRFVADIYRITSIFPATEIYGLTSQIRRASLSIPTNIAEGFARSTNADTARFIQIAIGSSSEVESLLIIASDLQFITPENVNSFIEEIAIIRKVLITLNKKLKTPVTY